MRSTHAVIDLSRLEGNYRSLRAAHAQGRLMTVVKANGYGHGLVPVARFLQSLGQDLFAVAILDEALALRAAGITGRILALGAPELHRAGEYAEADVELTLPSIAHLREAIAIAASGGGVPLPVHIKVDTGMGRIGLQAEAAEEALSLLKGPHRLRVRGVYSHFAESEQLASGFCEVQLAEFNRWRTLLADLQADHRPEFHLANSAGLMRDSRFHFDYARVGFALWAPMVFTPKAFAPEVGQPEVNRTLEPVLSLRTRVTMVKSMREGDTVGYSRTYTCRAGETIATLPVGYGDGLFRALSNKGQVLLAGRRRPIVGNVSMDQITISLGADTVAIGEEAVIIGSGGEESREGAVSIENGGEEITVAEMGRWAGTIDYEVLTHLGARIPRVYTHQGRVIDPP